jgi:AcrR family transcriptional regulator
MLTKERNAARTRELILSAAYRLFWRNGFGRAGVDEIAEAAGITKRTLYQHFRSKDDLLAAVLAAQHDLALARFATMMKRISGDGDAIVVGLFAEMAEWSAKPFFAGNGFSRFVYELADLPGHPAREIASRHKAAMVTRLAEILAGAGVADPAACANDVWVVMEGTMLMLLIHRDRRYAEIGAAAARRLLKRS